LVPAPRVLPLGEPGPVRSRPLGEWGHDARPPGQRLFLSFRPRPAHLPGDAIRHLFHKAYIGHIYGRIERGSGSVYHLYTGFLLWSYDAKTVEGLYPSRGYLGHRAIGGGSSPPGAAGMTATTVLDPFRPLAV